MLCGASPDIWPTDQCEGSARDSRVHTHTMTGASGFKVGQRLLLVVALLMTLRGTARAQTVQLWPEVSAFIKMTDSTRLTSSRRR